MELSYFAIIVGAIFVNTSCWLNSSASARSWGVSSKVETSLGMGSCRDLRHGPYFGGCMVYSDLRIGAAGGSNTCRRSSFILVIAALVQMVEIMLKKVSPSLYQALGIFLPLITTNCAVLGVAILMISKEFNLLQSIVYSVATAIGFALALVLFAGIRERLELEDVPKAVQGGSRGADYGRYFGNGLMGFSGLV